MPTNNEVTVLLNNESVVLGEPATVKVLFRGSQVAEIHAVVKKRQGADGDYYPAVEFEIKEGTVAYKR